MQVEIERLAFGAWGVGRVGGKVIFVRGGLPGEVVEVKITRDKGNYAEAEFREILKQSPERVKPPCSVFDKCGGCQWQHLEYLSQLSAKEDILRETLERIGGLKDVGIEPIVPSPKKYGYRNRVALSVWFQNGKYHIGYYEEGSHRLVAIEFCPIASEPINRAVFRLSEFLSSLKEPRYNLETVYAASDEDTAYVTLAPSSSRNPEKLVSLRDDLKEFPETRNVSVIGMGEDEFEFDLLGLRFYSTPSLFMQANREINERLIETAVEWAGLQGDEKVLDLYCGIGNFSLHLAREAGEVIGVEINKGAVRLGRKSGEVNSIKNVSFKALPCEVFLEQSAKRDDKFDLVVLDPPREGAKAVVRNLASLSPKRIIYVSCDPPTLARDLRQLEELSYGVVKVRPFDMFPETYHIETVALLVKS